MNSDHKALIDKNVFNFMAQIESSLPEMSFFGVSRKEVHRRVCQIILRDWQMHFNTKLEANSWEELPSFKNKKVSLDIGGFRLDDSESFEIEIDDRIVRSAKRAFFKRILQILAYSTLVSFKSLFNFSKPKKDLSLFLNLYLDGPIPLEKVHSSFKRFCFDGPLKEEFGGTTLVAQNPGLLPDQDGIHYTTKLPFLKSLSLCKFNFLDLAKLIFQSLRSAKEFLHETRKCPLFALNFRDCAHFPLVHVLNEKNCLKNILLTNSNYYEHELWFGNWPEKKFKSHMLWYSAGTERYRFKGARGHFGLPENEYHIADVHWVWNEQQANAIKEFPYTKEVRVKGPLMFYLASEEEIEQKNQIGIFDITPVKQEVFDAVHGKNVYYYNNAETVQRFLNDIIEVSGEAPLALKTKRAFGPKHNPDYKSFVDHLASEGKIKIPSANTNMFDFVKSCKAIIVLPFTSPALVAEDLGVPVVYYDPLGVLNPHPEETVTFVDKKTDLKRFVETYLDEA